ASQTPFWHASSHGGTLWVAGGTAPERSLRRSSSLASANSGISSNNRLERARTAASSLRYHESRVPRHTFGESQVDTLRPGCTILTQDSGGVQHKLLASPVIH